MAELDKIDLKILRLLQADGRMGNAEIARRVNLSPAACHRRVQALFTGGYVTGVHARIDPAKVDLGVLVLVAVVLDRSTPESFAAFEEAALANAAILECHLVAGDFDYMLKVRARDIDDFNAFHGSKLIALPGVRQTRTFFVLKQVRDAGPLQF
ncbi:Lrp/AsnC family transcriptional regulator [Chelatococcus sp. SYSU_G07232]|uniref:Lrp/AsnC family transcriptional regulator n=1 Tax=Chelatococcus albus TaxID=3047466 RepID=A0ABT7AGZ7_9HYPH|nr:Lrp/AsnC family transcriptional regulator [Chelatococcus sp. SYSU_G07232]MDJ1158629.1 Lrp/AsnC family transcriptional regulator [Chelatococcus sp. SYSU_G07232]